MPTNEEILVEHRLKKKSDYSDEEKIQKFDEFYDSALSDLTNHLNKILVTNKETYGWERVMDLLGHEQVWAAWMTQCEDSY